MLMITFSNVISRYIFHASFSFIDELTTALFVLLSTLGGASAAKKEAHYTLDLLHTYLKPKGRKTVGVINGILNLTATLILVITGLGMVLHQIKLNAKTEALLVPAWIYSIFVPIGCSVMFFRFLQVTVAKIKNKGE